MKKLSTLLFLALTFLPGSGRALPTPISTQLAPGLLEQVQGLFPPGQAVSPALLDFRVNPNLRLFREAEIRVTFIDEGAGYRNSFGYFLYQDANDDGEIVEDEISKRELLFVNVSKENSGGELKAGDTVSLGRFPAGSRVGFYLVANGAVEAEATYYTLDSLNPDGSRHLAMLALPDRENVILGIEDLPMDRSDRDFNDILFTFTTDPKSALQEVIEDSEIPVASSAPSTPTPKPEATKTPTDVVFQATQGPAMLQGGGLGCKLGSTVDGGLAGYEVPGILILLGLAVWRRFMRPNETQKTLERDQRAEPTS